MTSETPLLDWTPPIPRGKTFDGARDGKRLYAQARRVLEFALDYGWTALREISQATGDPEASVSARLRDLATVGFPHEKEFVARGLWRYRVSAGKP